MNPIITCGIRTGGTSSKLNALLTFAIVAMNEKGIIFKKEYKFNNYIEVVEKTPNDSSSGSIYVESEFAKDIDLNDLANNGVELSSVDDELVEYFSKFEKVIPILLIEQSDFIKENFPKFSNLISKYIVISNPLKKRVGKSSLEDAEILLEQFKH